MKVKRAITISLLFLVCLGRAFAAATESTVGVFYYPWYGNNNFHGGTSTSIRWHLVPQEQPMLGWYNQHDSSVISQHFKWARSCGIDYFIASYWGIGTEEDNIIRNMLFTNPDRGNMKVCVMLETDWPGQQWGILDSNLKANMEYLCDNYFNNPAYYRLNGKPVVYVYLTLTKSDSNLAWYIDTMRTTARNKGIGEIYIVGDEVVYAASTSNVTRVALMDAITSYSCIGSLAQWPGYNKYATTTRINSWQTGQLAWRDLANSAGRAFIPGVCPGFNDTAVRSGNPPLSRKLTNESSAEGSLFSTLIQKALASTNCGTIAITSWNEWHEDSQIEPVASAPSTNVVDGVGGALTNGIYYVGYGTLYLDILRNLTSVMPAEPTNPAMINPIDTSLTWIWRDNSINETGFRVYVDPGGNSPTTLRTTTGAGATYWTQVGLVANTMYTFSVAAINSGTESLRTTDYSAWTLASRPTPGANIICDKSARRAYPLGSSFSFSNPAGFGHDGAYKVSGFRYVWDSSPAHVWTGNEAVWSAEDRSFTPALSGSYYLHLQSLNDEGAANPNTLNYGPFVLDGIMPVTSAQPIGGVYDEVSVTLTPSEAATIYYTADGASPTTSSTVYTGPIAIKTDTTLKFYAVDEAGNAESSVKTEKYLVLSGNGSIAATKGLANGTAVRLGAKCLYMCRSGFGYIEELNRSCGIRVQGAIPVGEGSMVNLDGTLQKPVGAEPYILLNALTRTGAADVSPYGIGNRLLLNTLLQGLRVRVWGKVKPGSINGRSFTITDGSFEQGIRVDTASTPTVSEGNYVAVTGALGFDAGPVVYVQ